MKVGIVTIEKAMRSGNERKYATFLYLRQHFKKGCFYNYTHDSFSAESGLSKSTVRKYIKFFINAGWCYKHSGNLMFKGFKHFKDRGFDKTFILKSKTVNGILKEFYYIILKIKQGQFNKLKSVGRAIKTARSPKKLRRIDGFLEKFNLKERNLPSQNDTLKISSIGLSKMFMCSKSKANRIVNSLNKSKVSIIKGMKHKIITETKTLWHIDCNKFVVK